MLIKYRLVGLTYHQMLQKCFVIMFTKVYK
nr:MAG TPA: hypothetical protein [Caudoviricetes sp.]